MSTDWRENGRLLIVFVLLLAQSGCKSEPERLADFSVDVPDAFRDGQTDWKRQMTSEKSDNVCLQRFFTLNQDLAGSPEFTGMPAVFSSGANARRFYWLNASVDGMRWQCVEFRNRKFSVTEGTDNPF